MRLPLSNAPWTWRILAGLLVFGTGLVHLCYIARECPLDLAPDEAHYWDWSRHLDASYYSKGPLTAFLIRGSCELFGHSAMSVRLPAVAGGTLLLVGLYVLTTCCFRNERLAFLVIGITSIMPPFAISRTVMTIDSPFTCLWTWALVLGYHAIFRRATWAWPVLGMIVGLGILAKYTMALIVPCALLFLLLSSEHRRQLRQAGIWIAGALAALGCLPIVWWNHRHDWVSFRHVGNQAGVTIDLGSAIHLMGPLKYLGEQFALLLGVGFIAWVIASVIHAPWREHEPVRRYLWCMSVPVFLFFAVFSFRTDVLPNWPVAAYLGGSVLAAAWLDERRRAAPPLVQHAMIAGVAFFAIVGFLMTGAIHHTTRLQSGLTLLVGAPSETNPQPLRKIDPTCRMRGWRYLNAAVDVCRRDLQSRHIDPILSASRWTLASELAFYGEGHPHVYSVGSALWDRRSQFDIWRPNPVADPVDFHGRSFIFVDVGPVPDQVREAFETVEPTQTVRYEERGQLIAFWNITVCHGFRGFARTANRCY